MFSLTEVEGVFVATEEFDLHIVPGHSTLTTSCLKKTVEKVRNGCGQRVDFYVRVCWWIGECV